MDWTGLERDEQAGWWTHTDAIGVYGAVDFVRNALLVAEHYPGQQQHHRQHPHRSDANLGTEKILQTSRNYRATRLRIFGTILRSRNNTMQQYDLMPLKIRQSG